MKKESICGIQKDLSKLPIFEPGLDQVISETRGKKFIFFTEIEKKYKKIRNDFYFC